MGLGEDPQVLAIRAPALFGVSNQLVLNVASDWTLQLIATHYPHVTAGVPRN